ncbi:MAG TPA: peptide deformylase [Smithella sp.]|nr:peptide deformylase [Smithella sp.]HRS96887.1 peptide deformylase [Smithella sp.]
MSKSKILTLWTPEGRNDDDIPVLRKKSTEVKVPYDKETIEIIKTLVESFLERDDAVGLSAPQIGINRRVIVFRNKGFDQEPKKRNKNDFEVLVNPRITQSRGELVTMAEGCLSCPDIQVDVARFPEIKVRAFDATQEKVNKRYLDFVARIIQHEIDHLDGKLIVDYEGSMYYPKEKQQFFEKLFKA